MLARPLHGPARVGRSDHRLGPSRNAFGVLRTDGYDPRDPRSIDDPDLA
jgi:hypothetical protein